MVRCDHVAQHASTFASSMLVDLAGSLAHALEVGRVLNVGRCRWPVVGLGIGCFNALPLFVAFEHVRIFGLERFAGDRLLDQFRDFLRRGPDVFQVNVVAVLVCAITSVARLMSIVPAMRTPQRGVAMPGSWRARLVKCGLQSCGCRTERMSRPDRLRMALLSIFLGSGQSYRCRSCNRNQQG